MGTPPLAQRLKSTPAIRRPELYRQDIPELAIEVATSGLGPLEYAHDHVPSCRQSLGHDAQRYRLTGARIARDQGKTALRDQLFDPAGEWVDRRRHQQCLAGTRLGPWPWHARQSVSL